MRTRGKLSSPIQWPLTPASALAAPGRAPADRPRPGLPAHAPEPAGRAARACRARRCRCGSGGPATAAQAPRGHPPRVHHGSGGVREVAARDRRARTACGRRQRVHGRQGAQHRPRRRRVQPAFRHDALERLAEPLARRVAGELDRWRAGEAIDPAAEAHRIALAAMPLAVFGVSEEPGGGRDRHRRAGAARRDEPRAARPAAGARAGAAGRPAAPRGAPWPTWTGTRCAWPPSAGSTPGGRDLGARGAHRRRPGRPRRGGGPRRHGIRDGRPDRGQRLGPARPAPEWWTAVRREGAAPAVVAETLRLHPPTSLIARVARRDDTLPSGVAGGTAGRRCCCPPTWCSATPPCGPSRIASTPPASPTGDPGGARSYSYFPFGAGPRVCVGQGLARLEAAIVLSETAARFELAPGRRGKLAVRSA